MSWLNIGFPDKSRAHWEMNVRLASRHVRVVGVLVVHPIGLHERDGRQRPRLRRGDEGALVTQMRATRRALRVRGEVDERLVVVLEERLRIGARFVERRVRPVHPRRIRKANA